MERKANDRAIKVTYSFFSHWGTPENKSCRLLYRIFIYPLFSPCKWGNGGTTYYTAIKKTHIRSSWTQEHQECHSQHQKLPVVDFRVFPGIFPFPPFFTLFCQSNFKKEWVLQICLVLNIFLFYLFNFRDDHKEVTDKTSSLKRLGSFKLLWCRFFFFNFCDDHKEATDK